MSLEKWAENSWLKREATSHDEIKNLLSIVERDLKDASVALVSDDRRFEAAFSAARTLANVALRASGYRTMTQVGHHARTIESVGFTIRADSKLIQKMKTFSKKRNITSYDAAGGVSKQELELAIKTAHELRGAVLSWLQKNHPELLKG
jgi:hypothetical protein